MIDFLFGIFAGIFIAVVLEVSIITFFINKWNKELKAALDLAYGANNATRNNQSS